jgi:hypothetical protein
VEISLSHPTIDHLFYVIMKHLLIIESLLGNQILYINELPKKGIKLAIEMSLYVSERLSRDS